MMGGWDVHSITSNWQFRLQALALAPHILVS